MKTIRLPNGRRLPPGAWLISVGLRWTYRGESPLANNQALLYEVARLENKLSSTERDDAMTTARRYAMVLPLFVLAAGCGKPTAQDRDNRRVVDCVLTAITLRNTRLLEDDARWAAQRHDDGQLSDEAYQGLKAVIEKALQGDWLAAEEDGYRFRELHPFVEPGH